MQIKKYLSKNYVNFRGWSTKRKIVVIESDDWGSIRMRSKEAYEKFLAKNIPVDKNYFDKNDSLENTDDLTMLFEVLSSVKDKNGNPAVITPLTIVANPDFDKIEASNKSEYHYELITESYKKYQDSLGAFEKFKEGITKKVFYPQFHGREHFNVKRWMKAINGDSFEDKMAFEERSLITSRFIEKKDNFALDYQHAFSIDNRDDVTDLKHIIETGLQHFNDLFGFKSQSFCAPCSIQTELIDEHAFKHGVIYNQGGRIYVPQEDGTLKIKHRYLGDKNKFGQLYWRRNCTFEPSRNQNYDWVNQCMQEIAIAFRWGKPAVINSHRVNFIGGIFPENREQSLIKLKQLLSQIIQQWPDVEFMNSEELGNLIAKK